MIIGSFTKLEIGQKIISTHDAPITDCNYVRHANVAFVIIREATWWEWVDSAEAQTGRSMSEYEKKTAREQHFFYEILTD